MNLLQPSNSYKKQIITPSEFVEHYFKVDNGDYFSFKGRKYLIPIYNSIEPNIVIMSSRQAEKSTFIANIFLLRAMLKLIRSGLYISSRQSQVDDFVRMRINPQFENNPILKAMYLSRSRTNRLSDKILNNGVKLIFRAMGLNCVSIRGISAQDIYFDEVQSLEEKYIPIALECAHSYTEKAYYRFTGTPLSTKNYFTRLFNTTKQYEWIIQCQKCKKYNDPLGIKHIDPKKPYLFCQHCGKKLDRRYGEWVAQNPSSSIDGYRISRLMTPNARWYTKAKDGILDKYVNYPEGLFFNEVLGLPFDSGSFVLNKSEVYQWCSNDEMINPKKVPAGYIDTIQVMGIDWAWNNLDGTGSHTIITIATKYSDKIKIVYTKRFDGPRYHDPEVVLKEIIQLAIAFNVKIIATDYGVGHKENHRLKNVGKSEVVEFMYTGSLTKLEWSSKSKTYNIGKIPSMSDTFEKIKTGFFEFPRVDQFKSFAKDILNIYSEMDEKTKILRYEKAGPDDFLHTLNYILQAFNRLNTFYI